MNDIAFYRSLPKAELHCHLDGSLRPATMLALAQQQGVTFPFTDEVGLKLAVRAGMVREDLADYLTAFGFTLSVLQTEDALEQVARELVLDAASENVRHLEIRFSPLLHMQRDLVGDAIIDAVLSGIRAGIRETGISSGLILCGIRDLPPARTMEVALLAVKYHGRGVLGVDLAGPEKGFPSRDHAAAFAVARGHDVPLTIHAGEAEGAWSIADALQDGARRIGHGTHLIDDEQLLERVAREHVALEVCLRSNLETKSIARYADHPLGTFLERGVRVTLNTDNRLMSDTDLSSEYQRAAETFAWSREQLFSVVENGFISAFLSDASKANLLRTVRAELSSK